MPFKSYPNYTVNTLNLKKNALIKVGVWTQRYRGRKHVQIT